MPLFFSFLLLNIFVLAALSSGAIQKRSSPKAIAVSTNPGRISVIKTFFDLIDFVLIYKLSKNAF